MKGQLQALSVHILVATRVIHASIYRLNEHEKTVHGTVVDECTKNFSCPLDCGVCAFRTNKELLFHCEMVHHEKLGMYTVTCIIIISCCRFKGFQTLTFSSMREFLYCKEWEEETTYSTYVKKQQTYNPSSNGR